MLVGSSATSMGGPWGTTERTESSLPLLGALGHPDGHAVVMKGVVTAGTLGKILVGIHVVEADGTVGILLGSISTSRADLQLLHGLSPTKIKMSTASQNSIFQPASQNPGLLPLLVSSEERLDLKLLEFSRCEATVVLGNAKHAQHYEEDVEAARSLVA